MWFGMCGANASAAVPVYTGSNRVPEEYTESTLEADTFSAWWQFENLQKLVYPGWWEYSEGYLDVKKKLDEFQNGLFSETPEMEKRVIEQWKNGEQGKAKEILSDYTYEKLDEALKVAKKAISSVQ